MEGVRDRVLAFVCPTSAGRGCVHILIVDQGRAVDHGSHARHLMSQRYFHLDADRV